MDDHGVKMMDLIFFILLFRMMMLGKTRRSSGSMEISPRWKNRWDIKEWIMLF
jgi:hypothetical protein